MEDYDPYHAFEKTNSSIVSWAIIRRILRKKTNKAKYKDIVIIFDHTKPSRVLLKFSRSFKYVFCSLSVQKEDNLIKKSFRDDNIEKHLLKNLIRQLLPELDEYIMQLPYQGRNNGRYN